MQALTKLFFTSLLLITVSVANAQKGGISGKIFSSALNTIIGNANIRLIDKDSMQVSSQLTDSAGNFAFSDITSGIYTLRVEAISYSIFNKSVLVLNNEIVHDTILLEPFFQDLQSVVVTAKKPAVVIKPDTTEFNASSFKTDKNATIEDIFKKMPGVEVNNNGSIKSQGEPITQIYVDGKPFFGNDLKAVTQIFPADMIDKIQIIDKKSDQALATKVDDGSTDKIINITLKKGNKKSTFGKDYASYGSDNHYEAKATLNLFNNDKKLSIIAGANNTGRNDAGNNSSAAGSGITENKQVKINYADKFGSNFDFSVWAGYDENKNNLDQFITRQTIFFDSSTNYSEKNKNVNLTNNFYSGLFFEYRPDTFSLIRFNESVNFLSGNNNLLATFNTIDENAAKINEGNYQYSGLSEVPSLNGQISYNRRLSNSGRNLFLSFSNFINDNSLTTYNNFNNYFYSADTSNYLFLKQSQYNHNKNTNIGTTVSYSEPLAPNNTLNFSYTYNSDKNNMPKEVYDFNDQTGEYNLLDDTLSYHFINSTYSNAVSMNYNYTTKKVGFGAGLRWKESVTQSHSLGKDNLYQQSFNGLLPNLSFYSIGKGKRLNVYFNSFIQAPQPYQLQPMINNTNPLFISMGNTSLKYAVIHMLRYNFKYYNTKKESGFNSNASFSMISNNIATSVSYDNTTGKQISQPINSNGAYNWNAWLTYFAPLHIGIDKIKWNINLNAGEFKTNTLLYERKNITRNDFVRMLLSLGYDTPEWINLRTDISLTKQTNKYSLQPMLNNTSYYVNISPNITFKVHRTEMNIDYNYQQTAANPGFNTSLSLLNLHLTQYFDSKKNVWLTLSAFNVFNEKAGVVRLYGDNFIQNSTTNCFPRYFLFTVNFRLNKIPN